MLQPDLAGYPASKHTKIVVFQLLSHAVVGPALLFCTPVTMEHIQKSSCWNSAQDLEHAFIALIDSLNSNTLLIVPCQHLALLMTLIASATTGCVLDLLIQFLVEG